MPLVDRPKLLGKRTFRLPMELEAFLEDIAADRRISVNELILTALENDLSRCLTYRLSLYSHLMPTLQNIQRRHCQTLSACPVVEGVAR